MLLIGGKQIDESNTKNGIRPNPINNFGKQKTMEKKH